MFNEHGDKTAYSTYSPSPDISG